MGFVSHRREYFGAIVVYLLVKFVVRWNRVVLKGNFIHGCGVYAKRIWSGE